MITVPPIGICKKCSGALASPATSSELPLIMQDGFRLNYYSSVLSFSLNGLANCLRRKISI